MRMLICFLVSMLVIPHSIFAGNCGSSPSRRTKVSRIVPEPRVKVTPGKPGEFDVIGFTTVVMPSPVSSSSLGSSRYKQDSFPASATHSSFLGSDIEDSITDEDDDESVCELAAKDAQEAYVEIWIQAKHKLSAMYELLRQIALNLKTRLDNQRNVIEGKTSQRFAEGIWGQSLDAYCVETRFFLARISEIYAKNEKLVRLSGPVFHTRTEKQEIVLGRHSFELWKMGKQECPECGQLLPVSWQEKKCICGESLVIPHNFTKMAPIMLFLHKEVCLFVSELASFNRTLLLKK